MFGLSKDNTAIDAFASTMVQEFSKRFPPARQSELGGTKLKPARDLAKASNDVEAGVTRFAREQQLGIYGKARLLNQIQWQMKELGYSADFVEATTTELAKLVGAQKK